MRAAAGAVALAAALLAPGTALAQGCAMCKRNLEENGGAGLIEGFQWSILLLVGTPLVLAGTFLLLLRRAARTRAAAADPAGVVAATGLEPVT